MVYFRMRAEIDVFISFAVCPVREFDATDCLRFSLIRGSQRQKTSELRQDKKNRDFGSKLKIGPKV